MLRGCNSCQGMKAYQIGTGVEVPRGKGVRQVLAACTSHEQSSLAT